MDDGIPNSKYDCWQITAASGAKTAAEPIEMPFGVWNHSLGGAPYFPTRRNSFFWGGVVGIPGLASGRYSQRYSQGAGAMQPPALRTVAVCRTCQRVKCRRQDLAPRGGHKTTSK